MALEETEVHHAGVASGGGLAYGDRTSIYKTLRRTIGLPYADKESSTIVQLPSGYLVRTLSSV